MKLLIPVDFSLGSDSALNYGANLAKILNTELHIIHVIKDPSGIHTSAININKLKDIIKDDSENEILKKRNEVAQKFPEIHTIITKVITDDSVENALKSYSQLNQIDLIIMGTHGYTGITKLMFGSVTRALINNSEIPVIAIPMNYTFKTIKNIVYASDFSNLEKEVEEIIPLSLLLNSKLTVINAIHPNSDDKNNRLEDFKELSTQLDENLIQLHLIESPNLLEGIITFIQTEKPELVVLYTHKLSLYEQLFDLSVSQNIMEQIKTPLLMLRSEA
jgi:nucleotide-binding universal stress UspA family protein